MDFVNEFQKLLQTAPQISVNSRNSQNCPYGDRIYNCSNCYLCFELGGSHNGFYLDNSMKTRNCGDCSFVRYSELCYECLNVEKSYNCNFCVDCFNCRDLQHCFDCTGCSDCFGCVGLRRQSYCIYNQQYTKDAYRHKLRTIQFDLKKFEQLSQEHPRLYSHQSNAENCIGDYIANSQNCFRCFDINHMQDCLYYCSGNFDSMDTSSVDVDSGSGNELCYDCFSIGYSYNCNFVVHASKCSDCEFGWNLNSCAYCFGCVYLQQKEFYILNQPYPKEEYFQKVAEIKDELKKAEQYSFDLLTTAWQSQQH